nr:uncharacterized protein LOC105339516 [Crassostrea gigas]
MALMLRLLYGAFVWVPCCVFGLYFPDSAEEYEVLMLLHSGGGISVGDAWLNTSDISGLTKHHRNLTLRELILDGDYRTDLNVDQLPFDEVYMVFLNALADPLWWIAFNGTAVEETKWFQEVTQSSSNIWDYNVTVNISRSSESFYSLYVGTGESVDPAWAAILNSSNLGIPYFIFNADPSMPHEFSRGEYNVYVIQLLYN